MNETLNYSNLKIPGTLFSTLLQDAITTTTGFYIEKIEDSEDVKDENEIVGTMVMVGNKNLLLMLSADEKSARTIVSYMTGIEISDLSSAMLCDGITELINMVGGGSRIAFENTQYKFSMSVPFTITGKDVNIIVKNRTERFISNFTNGDIKLGFKIFEL